MFHVRVCFLHLFFAWMLFSLAKRGRFCRVLWSVDGGRYHVSQIYGTCKRCARDFYGFLKSNPRHFVCFYCSPSGTTCTMGWNGRIESGLQVSKDVIVGLVCDYETNKFLVHTCVFLVIFCVWTH